MKKGETTTIDNLWRESVAFHGHECGGLKIGFMAALYGLVLMDMAKIEKDQITFTKSEDEELVTISENDACGIDAIQYITGCTMGKGNLKLAICGKQAFNFYNRTTGKELRIVLKENNISKDEMMKMPLEEVFEITDVHYPLPKKAQIYKSIICDVCGEKTAEPYITICDGQSLCPYCAKKEGETI